MRKLLASLALLATILAACGGAAAPGKASGPSGSHLRWSQPPAMQIDTAKTYTAVLHTSYGSITIDLLAKKAPDTVNNFVFLAKHNFFNGDHFFRIVKAFMIQTGDPNNNGTGGPGYHFADELPPALPYGPGVVAMANAGPDTNGSQFFICTQGSECAYLNQQPNYTVFGKVAQGMSVVEKIAAIPVKPNPAMGNEKSLPTKVAKIDSVSISTK